LKKIKSMIFVCLGNTCRSPAAEGFTRKFARDAFPPSQFEQLRIESAGLNHVFTGAQPQSIKFVKQLEGEDISHHVSRMITADMAEKTDLIVVMEAYMKDVIVANLPAVKNLQSKLFTLKELCPELHPAGTDIEDPYMMPDENYLAIIEEIRKYTRGFVSRWAFESKKTHA